VGRGILTGGDGPTDVPDHSFVTSIDFILKRLAAFGIKANIFPSPNDLSPLYVDPQVHLDGKASLFPFILLLKYDMLERRRISMYQTGIFSRCRNRVIQSALNNPVSAPTEDSSIAGQPTASTYKHRLTRSCIRRGLPLQGTL
jgi:hypothetical protein